MYANIFAAVLFTVGLLVSEVNFQAADKEPPVQDCCAKKLACCGKDKACCVAPTKLGCCAKGLDCCAKDKACCSGLQDCCKAGAACCAEGKACCGKPAGSANP